MTEPRTQYGHLIRSLDHGQQAPCVLALGTRSLVLASLDRQEITSELKATLQDVITLSSITAVRPTSPQFFEIVTPHRTITLVDGNRQPGAVLEAINAARQLRTPSSLRSAISVKHLCVARLVACLTYAGRLLCSSWPPSTSTRASGH